MTCWVTTGRGKQGPPVKSCLHQHFPEHGAPRAGAIGRPRPSCVSSWGGLGATLKLEAALLHAHRVVALGREGLKGTEGRCHMPAGWTCPGC